MSHFETPEHDRRRRRFIAGIAALLAVIAAAIAVPLALSGGSSSRTRSAAGGGATTAHTSATSPATPSTAKAKPPARPASTASAHPSPRPTSPRPATPAGPSASGTAPTARGDQIPGRKSCPPSPAMTSAPEGNCEVAQAVFTEALRFYKQTGQIPAQVAVSGPGGTVSRLSCAVLVPADEVTCTSQQYDAQFLLSAVGAKPPPGY